MRRNAITTLAITAGIAVAGIAPAAGLADATGPGKHTPAEEQINVYAKPNQGWSGTLEQGETFTVKRLSPSGKYAYGMAYGDMNRHGWVLAAGLERK